MIAVLYPGTIGVGCPEDKNAVNYTYISISLKWFKSCPKKQLYTKV